MLVGDNKIAIHSFILGYLKAFTEPETDELDPLDPSKSINWL